LLLYFIVDAAEVG